MMYAPNDLDAYWMPFTPNRHFKAQPKLMARAKGMYYHGMDGKEYLDAIAGLWCCNIGHCDPRVVQAIQAQAADLDYALAFNMGHPRIFELASRVAALFAGDIDHVFFTNSGSEAVDTALKMALAYHRIRGEGGRTRLIGRERGYHGVGFGGISVGGMVNNRKMFGAMLGGVDHLGHTHNPEHNAFSKGQPAWGGHLADDLKRLVALHDASTIAAVIVEPVAGSTGVLVPPLGYLDRLRAICDKHGILLIFDEVISGFGRTGKGFAVETFGVQPDIVTMAKGLTSGTVPMGAVAVRKHVYDAFMTGPSGAIEFFHGYTYSGHPLATAAALATLDVYRDDHLFERAEQMAPAFEDAVHSLRGCNHVIDIRNIGLVAGIELAPRAGAPTARAMDVFQYCYDRGVIVRTTGDTIALSPPLIIMQAEIARIIDTVKEALAAVN
jgi:beta-alanine--pyruvate transaminase